MDETADLTPIAPAGLVSRRGALEAGLSSGQVRARVRRGEWRTVRPGWFVPRDEWDALDVFRGRPLVEVLAAHRSLTEPHAVSHVSSALVRGLPFLQPRASLIHVTKLKGPRTRIRAGVKHHQARCLIPVVEQIAGFPVLTAARTALDVAREDGFAAGVVILDAVRQRGTSLAELELNLGTMRHWPHVAVVRDALAFSDPGAESPGESLMRILVDELDLGTPMETQFELRDATGWARCDLRVGRHVFEFDGAIKYRMPDRGGVASVEPARVLMAEKHRQDWVVGFQLGMSRVVWDDLFGLKRERTKTRLRREYAATVVRFGTQVDDLASFVVRRATS